MQRRLLDVTAYTTLDFVTARAEGAGWTDEGVAVVDVTTPDDADRVDLDVELDPADADHVPHHADRLGLSPEQARTLAADLQDAAADADDS